MKCVYRGTILKVLAGRVARVISPKWCKGSTVLGIGKADGQRNGMKCTYYVARYKPAGNVAVQMKQNVL